MVNFIYFFLEKFMDIDDKKRILFFLRLIMYSFLLSQLVKVIYNNIDKCDINFNNFCIWFIFILGDNFYGLMYNVSI